MTINTFNCPFCGGKVEVSENADSCVCSYCGSHIEIGKHISINKKETFVDQARIREAELKTEIKQKELEQKAQDSQRGYKKWKAIFIVCVAAALAIFAAIMYSNLKIKKIKAEYQQQIGAANAEEEKVVLDSERTITVATVKEAIKPASDLIAYKYFYSDIGEFSKDKKVFKKWSIPFTKEEVIYTYSGEISLGANISDVGIEVNENKKVITITIPEIVIKAHQIDNKSFKAYNIKKSVFTDIDMNDQNEFQSELKQREEEKISENDNIWETAQQNFAAIIKDLLSASISDTKYSIEIVYK